MDRLQVIHLAGFSDLKMLEEFYKTLPVKSKVFAFLNEMQYAYSAADLVIGRAGASSVAEIFYFRLPSLLIPYPFAGAHQLENARVLAKRGAALLLEEEKFTPALLNGLLDIFLDDAMRRKTMSAILASMEQETQGERVNLSETVFV